MSIWSDEKFAADYAKVSVTDVNAFEMEKGEMSVISLIPREAKTVLDYGCGSGHFTNRISEEYEVVGFDIAESARNIAKQSFPDLEFIGEVEGKFDCIVLKLVLHLVDNPKSLLADLAQHLSGGGALWCRCHIPLTLPMII